MSHTVGEKAALAVAASQRQPLKETRTDEQRIKDLRKNLANNLWIMPDDIRLLLNLYDAAVITLGERENSEKEVQQLQIILEAANFSLESTRADRDRFAHEVVVLQAQVEQFRTVYETENRSQNVTLERFIPQPGEVLEPVSTAVEAIAAMVDTDQHRMDDDGAAVAHPDAPASVIPLPDNAPLDEDIPF